ncbi:MAG: hypothetical protein AAGN82_14400 [Myxococcota bacterium]
MTFPAVGEPPPAGGFGTRLAALLVMEKGTTRRDGAFVIARRWFDVRVGARPPHFTFVVTVVVVLAACGAPDFDGTSTSDGGAPPDAMVSSGGGGPGATAGGGPDPAGCVDARRERPTGGSTRYLSHDGTSKGCNGGTKANPWRRWRDATQCLQPGDTLLVRPGVYRSDDDDIFASQSLELRGDPNLPIWVAPDEEADENGRTVTFRGTFAAHGMGYVIEGIEFVGPAADKSVILQVPGRHIEFRDISVHGTPDPALPCHEGAFYGGECPRRSPQFDCIKILSNSGSIRVEDISVYDSEVGFCAEDCIDVTGARGLRYEGNSFHHCRTMQVKGGTEDITIEANSFIHLWSGPAGASMSCTDRYCGSPAIPKLPLEDRFVARDVAIVNNLFVDIGRFAINASGWQDAQIAHNTFIGAAPLVATIHTGEASFDFYDKIATGIDGGCDQNDCKIKVAYSTKRLNVSQNIFYVDPDAIEVPLALWEEAPNPVAVTTNVFSLAALAQTLGPACGTAPGPCGLSLENNWIEDPGLERPEAPYSRASARLHDTSFSVDRGLPGSALCQDLFLRPRDDLPDLGAFELERGAPDEG